MTIAAKATHSLASSGSLLIFNVSVVFYKSCSIIQGAMRYAARGKSLSWFRPVLIGIYKPKNRPKRSQIILLFGMKIECVQCKPFAPTLFHRVLSYGQCSNTCLVLNCLLYRKKESIILEKRRGVAQLYCSAALICILQPTSVGERIESTEAKVTCYTLGN